MYKCSVSRIAAIVASIGAVNWGIYAIYQTDIVSMIYGNGTLEARIIYGLIAGMGFLVLIAALTCGGKTCDSEKK